MSVFRHSRELPATVESVFAVFQDPVRLARWWGWDDVAEFEIIPVVTSAEAAAAVAPRL